MRAVEVISRLSKSFREPQATPSDHCYTILQDHGSLNGGWGPASVVLPWGDGSPRPFVYTGSDPTTIDVMGSIVRGLAMETGKATILAKFTKREDVLHAEPELLSSEEAWGTDENGVVRDGWLADG